MERKQGGWRRGRQELRSKQAAEERKAFLQGEGVPHQPLTPKRAVRFIGSVSMIFIVIALVHTAAYYGMPYVYRMMGVSPSGLVLQIANAFAAIFLLGLTMVTFGLLTRSRHTHLFWSIVDAMRRMARGDFDVKVEGDTRMAGQYGLIVESINHMASELGQMEKMRQEFISNVSHELQSPLTSISGFAKALRKEGLDAVERLHYLDIIEQESVRLSKLSDNLLKLTSLESEHQPFEPKKYRLDKQLVHLILTCEPQWQEKEIEIDMQAGEISVVADEQLMSQVWLNLLHNAIKFTPRGGVIRFSAERTVGATAISVSDNGIGIAEADQPHVFERFFKSDASRSRAAGGSGLGLAIVKRIVDLHKGTVRVSGSLGNGTTFTVVLPDAAEPEQAHGRRA